MLRAAVTSDYSVNLSNALKTIKRVIQSGGGSSSGRPNKALLRDEASGEEVVSILEKASQRNQPVNMTEVNYAGIQCIGE